MATQKYTLSERVWQRISDPGEQGTCWLRDTGGGIVAIAHTALTELDTIDVGSAEEAAAGLDENAAYILDDLNDVLSLPPDKEEDVFYALMIEASRNDRYAVLVVDNLSGIGSGQRTQDVSVQDQTTDVVDYYVCRNLSELTLAAPTVIDTYTIDVVDGSAVVNGNYICIQGDARAFQAQVLSGGGTNTLTLDTPIDYAFSVDSFIQRRTPNLNVDGSITPVIAVLNPIPGVKWDVVRIIGNIITPFSNGAPTDEKFGGNTALTRGIVIRKTNGIHHTIFNAKTNEELKLRTGPSDTVYTPSVASGPYGVGFRRTFGGQDKNGVVIRLNGNLGDRLEVVIQDNMTGYTSFKMVAQGHIVEP